MNKVIQIEGLDCANCARELEEKLQKVAGVNAVSVDFMAQKVRLDYSDETAVTLVTDICNHFEEVRVITLAQTDTAADDKLPLTPEYAATNGQSGGKKIKIKGLCCANCGRELEEILNKIEGVSAVVDFMNMTITLTASGEAYDKAIYEITHFEDVEIVEGVPVKQKGVLRSHLKEIIQLVVAVIFFAPAVVLFELGGTLRIVSYPLFGISYLSAGLPVLINTVKNIAHGRIFDENFLMTIASVGAILLGIFWGDGLYEGVAVMILYQLGELLQSVAVGSSRKSITALMDLKSDSATIIKNGGLVQVTPEELQVGDIMLIKAGEKVAADGVIKKGESALDMRSLNGEALPMDVCAGQEILSGSINLNGVIEVEVTRRYSDSAVAKILDLVENSTAKKAQSEKFITKFAKYYTPAVCVAAILVAALVPTVICAIESSFLWNTYANWIYRALSFLVISCPCALVISVPLAYFGGIGQCARFGILAKGSTCLDELAKAQVAAFDKTGTLTEGSFSINKYSDEKTLRLAAAAEKYSSHPIAKAFSKVTTEYNAENEEEVAGRGVKCTVNGKTLLCGNAKLMQDNGVAFTPLNSAYTVVYVVWDGKYTGYIEIGDKVKKGAKEAVDALRLQGVNYCAMLTGDSALRAQDVAGEVGLDGCFAALLPDGKLEKAEELKQKGNLIYVGDGINDAPVMAAADCAVSMSKVGSDAAIEASDIVLVTDSLELLAKAKKIAKGTRRIVFQNIIGSLVIKLAIMVLSLTLSSFPLIVAVVADVGVMLLAVLNSMRTRLIK